MLVLGMHRSGTSATARLLSLLGASLPPELIAADDSNQSGYWEPTRINSFNNEMLKEAGSSWDDWCTFDIDRALPDRASYYRTRLREILYEDFGSAPLSVLKDPRVARLVPLYAEALNSLGIEPLYLLVLRNPLSVAASLASRDGMPPEQSSLLWLRHLLDAELSTRNATRSVITFESLIENWRTVARKISTDLNLDLPAMSRATEDAIDNFLSGDKRHHDFDAGSLERNAGTASATKSAFFAALDLERTHETSTAMATLDGARETLNALEELTNGRMPIPQGTAAPTLLGFEGWLRRHNLVNLSEVEVREERLTAALEVADERARIAEQEKQELERRLSLLTEHLAASRSEVAAKTAALDETRRSTSWRITTPVRLVKITALQLKRFAKTQILRVARRVWHRLPMSQSDRQTLKRWLVRAAPSLLSAYAPPPGVHASEVPASALEPYRAPASGYVPRLADAAPLAPSTRVIAFYLPQFHSIPENDKWWGDGFTEWTNVAPAKPHFIDHYQPHVPDDLGYYDLSDTSVQERQIELAKLYGVGGFCFYFYWFAGKRLLETPILNYLDNPSLDLPFMLCWANENWSRRWDGLENELLIRQEHSPDDDLAFIQYISKYLRDPRYIRIDGKPVLVIYRPSQLPSATETSKRWRSWCRSNGIGEIYLAYTQSFEHVDPAVYGLDGAIEFPPNNSSPPDVTDTVTALDDNFTSRVYDWSAVAQRSETYRPVGYDLFRSVCPGWDNTARRKNKASVFVHNTPYGFSRWLANAIADTAKRFESESSRLVFVNAWNEWAEGAHLEPDARNGYAYLEAVRVTLQRSMAVKTANVEQEIRRPVVVPAAAIVVHAYYPDVLDEILERVTKLDERHRLFVTTDSEHCQQVQGKLEATGRWFSLHVIENRGRDVLPFLKVLKHVRAEKLEYVVKVHTKKSLHRQDGAEWRQQLYDALLSHDVVERALRAFVTDPTLGMVGPDGHFVSMETYLGSNRSHIFSIGQRLGLTYDQIMSQGFFAGTMFAVRLAALSPLCSLSFSDEDFGEEAGQIDGTLAHAMERAFALSVKASGQKMMSTQELTSVGVAAAPKSKYAFGGSDGQSSHTATQGHQ